MRTFRNILAVAVFFLACGLFAAENAETDTAPLVGSLQITTNVSKADVYLDGGFIGTTPLTIEGLEPGLHRVSVAKEGFYTESRTVRIIAGEETSIKFEMRPMTGTLKVLGIPERTDFELVIDGKKYESKQISLGEGSWSVTVRIFGYADSTETVTIQRNKTTTLDCKSEKTAFLAEGLSPSKKAFNPENPARLGTVEILFTVSAPGSGTITVRDETGTMVKSFASGVFDTWKQSFIWNGTDEYGAKLPDGTYSIELASRGEDGSAETALSSMVGIDHSIVYPLTGTATGIGSTGPVVSAARMPAEGIQFTVDGHAMSGEYGPSLSVLAGIGPFAEAGASFAYVLGEDSSGAADIAGGIKAGMNNGPLSQAVSLAWRLRTEKITDGPTPVRKGLSFGVPVEYSFGNVSVGAFPSVAWGNDEGLPDDAYFTASFGVALRFSSGNLSGGTWVNADSLAFGSDFKPLGSASAGVSLAYIIPSTNLVLSAEGGYVDAVETEGKAFVRGGFGVVF